MQSALILLSKSPQAPRVKTRLARQTSPEFARTLYRCFLQDLAHSLAPLEIDKKLYHAPPTPAAAHELGEIFTPDWQLYPQTVGDLGQRMAHAFQTCFEMGYAQIILIGGDLPDLPPDYLKSAFNALQSHAFVLGPSEDGGYYLIGAQAQAYSPQVFELPDWRFETTHQWLENQGYSCYHLPPWQDMDTLEDLKNLVNYHQKYPLALPFPQATLSHLRQFGQPWLSLP